MNSKRTLITGAALAFLGVAIGAFGAHALKPSLLANNRLDTFELAVRYQFYHAFALLFLGLWMQKNTDTWLSRASISWLMGVILFSGSLYLLSLTNNTSFAMLTPIGGLFFLAGWCILLISLIRQPN